MTLRVKAESGILKPNLKNGSKQLLFGNHLETFPQSLNLKSISCVYGTVSVG